MPDQPPKRPSSTSFKAVGTILEQAKAEVPETERDTLPPGPSHPPAEMPAWAADLVETIAGPNGLCGEMVRLRETFDKRERSDERNWELIRGEIRRVHQRIEDVETRLRAVEIHTGLVGEDGQ